MTHAASPLLQVQGLSKRFTPQGPWVVHDVSFDVHPGEILALVGPSGCGKTTTLRLIAGFERPDAGCITLGSRVLCEQSNTAGSCIPPEKRGVGIVFQDYALFPHRTVLGNVTFGMTGPSRDRQDKAMALLAMLDMDALAHRRPQTLSGGQQQRVALARTLAAQPRLILLDEPFSNLDVTLRESARREVRQTLQRQGVATILVTHDREEALSVGDRVAVMHQGRLLQLDTPETVYHQPREPFVAGFLGGLIQLTGHAQGDTADTPLGTLALSRPARGPIDMALRPEQVQLVPQGDTPVVACIEHREFRGHTQTLILRIDGQRYRILADSLSPHPPGGHVSVRVVGQAIVFDTPTSPASPG